MTDRAAGHGDGLDAIEFVAQFLPVLPFEEFGERHRLPHGEVHGDHCSTFPHLLLPGDAEGRSAMRVRGLGGGRSLPGRNRSERNIRVVDGRPSALLRFRAIVLAVVRALAQALDPLAGKRDAIERLAILLPLRLAHRAGGEDEIALDDVALDVAARGLAEDGDFVPAGALDPFAAVVAAAEARSDAHAQRGADLLDFANAADDREFRDRVHYPFLLSVSPRAFGSCRRSLGVRLTKSRARQASTREKRAGRSVQRRAAEGGDFAARGIRPLGRRGKSSSVAVAAWIGWL